MVVMAHTAANGESVKPTIDALRQRHIGVVRALGIDDEELSAELAKGFEELEALSLHLASHRDFPSALSDQLLSHGDRLAARILAAALSTTGTLAQFIDGVDIIRADGPRAQPLSMPFSTNRLCPRLWNRYAGFRSLAT